MDINRVSEKTGIKGKVLQEIIQLAKKIVLKKLSFLAQEHEEILKSAVI